MLLQPQRAKTLVLSRGAAKAAVAAPRARVEKTANDLRENISKGMWVKREWIGLVAGAGWRGGTMLMSILDATICLL